ncbi:MAG: glycosyltransferase family 2 protein [Candidatus Aminicenantes bacterium]|nr:glycosyltransferase family 2 protein [Candidatus Aminicenantes bacterium]
MVSAIIVTYNRAAFLKEAIDSVLAQTYFQKNPGDWELLVIDDGSTDGTRELVESYCQRSENIRYHYTEHRGVSPARNLGLNLAQGEFIAFLDSDDLWLKEKIQVQLSYLKAFPEAMFCLTEEIWIRHGRRVNQARKHQKYSGWVLDKVLPLCLLSLSSAMFRRRMFDEIGQFDESLPVCEDYDLGIRIALRYPYHFLPSPLIIKRGGHPDQLSRKYWGMDRWRIRALIKALELEVNPDQEKLIKQEIQKKCEVLISGFLKRGKTEEAEYYLKIKDRYQPA